MARIGVDATTVAPGGKGNALSERKAVEGLASLGRFELVAFVRSAAAARMLDVETVRVRAPKAVLWEQLEQPRRVSQLRLDAMLTLSERLPLWGRGRYVVWLFELPTHRIEINRRTGAGAYQRGADYLTEALWKRSLRRAAVVAAGSRATADELEREVPALRGRVRVVYAALGEGFSPDGGPHGGRYVFHLASSDPRDNSEVAVEAFARAAPDDVRLVVGGGLGARERVVREAARRHGVERRLELTGRLSDKELVARYRGAAAYVDPSLFEGFGYQVLEAMACGVPVVASTATSIPEVVGDAGLLCDARSPQAFADALARVLNEPGLADDLRRRGLERARLFTWERTAEGLAGAIDEALAR
jgi:glycosyltransferase involved in cell wall biosynthesis